MVDIDGKIYAVNCCAFRKPVAIPFCSNILLNPNNCSIELDSLQTCKIKG